jgi:glutamate-5-semialdehyde dehydrogenase
MSSYFKEIILQSRQASRAMSKLTAEDRSKILMNISGFLLNHKNDILQANQLDVERAKSNNLSEPMVNRLILTSEKIDQLSQDVDKIAQMPDPLNQELEIWDNPSNGLRFSKVSVALGVIGIIYESRPNVTIDAASLCLRSGNVSILRGGSECIETNKKLYECIQQALKDLNFNPYLVCFIQDTDRSYVQELLQAEGDVDVIIPRGGKSLIQTISKNSKVPTLKHLEGICHTVWDQGYDKDHAAALILNAKLRRPEICGATETLLIHKDNSAQDITYVLDQLKSQGCEIIGCSNLQKIYAIDRLATKEDWATEYLDKKISVKIVENIEDSVDHINQFSSGHTESCLTSSQSSIDYFFKNCKSAILMHNASTQFADGGEFGFGAEIGISTDKLHVRGPVGAKHLTTFKYQVSGNHTTRP